MARSSTTTAVVAALVIGTLLGGMGALVALAPGAPGTGPGDATAPTNDTVAGLGLDAEGASLVPFESRTDFEEYVRAGRTRGRYVMATGGTRFQAGDGGGDGAAGGQSGAEVTRTEAQATAVSDAASGDEGAGDGPDRIGSTNVQVEALDEPDLVKADDGQFYYAPRGAHYPRPVVRDDVADSSRPAPDPGSTRVIDVDDPAAPAVVEEINASGRLLRTGDTLVVIEGDRLRGFDVSDPDDPEQTWTHDLEASVVTARERGGTVYLVTRTDVHRGPGCPVEPLGGPAAIECTDVLHPRSQIQVDATYTALALEAASGDVGESVSFVGSGRNTVVYMSPDALYVTYTKSADRYEVTMEYVLEEAEGVPEDVRERVREIRSYDISRDSKMREVSRAMDEWFASLPEDEREERREAFREGVRTYLGDHQRDLTTTGIVRIDVDGSSLAVDETGTVPGTPLNQFSMSEHEGTLRITTTVPSAGDVDSANDLYVLEADTLERRGEVTGMGLNERVYSVRYVGDTAYVVTFRRIDPFHVVDLSDPSDPTVKGELKLPGFSEYLHPIGDDYVLGIGQEDSEVKAVLFDVSDPTNPTVADDLLLDQRWSAISESHHAFTIDQRHGVFFLPAGEKGLVVNYTGGDLLVETSVETSTATQRARYVDDYLYVFAPDEVIVLDETTWDRETALDLAD